ncbi:MAG: hypothetical protein ACJ74T_08155 [Pyrinomonadaceae bacterium]
MHSFIIKLRLEKTVCEPGPTTWHGYITHVPSGRRSYLRDLDGIAAFITPYLEAEGVKTGLRRRVWRRVKGLKSKDKKTED